jgi:hypothetical protein
MDNKITSIFKLMGSRVYIVGREGHIYINDPSVSKKHAEIQIINDKVHLRDLGSANGTYLVKSNKLFPFKEGFVRLHQSVVIGNQIYTIQGLLGIVNAFADNKNRLGLVNALASAANYQTV